MAKRSEKILVVEDDPVLNKVLMAVLQNKGYAVDCSTNGENAWEKIKHHAYGLVLLDLIMPRMGGMEVLRKMKDAKNLTPVLVFTNLSQEENKIEAMSLGAKGYYVKSDMSIREVVQVVRRFFKKNNPPKK